MKRPVWISAVSLATLFLGAASAQQLYRWTDESGRVHYSNAGPAGEDAAADETDSAPAPASDEPKSASAGKAGEYSDLSEDSFSSVASRRRGDLQRELRSARRRVRDIDSEIASLTNKSAQAQQRAATQLQGVTVPQHYASPREEELLEEKKELEQKIGEIHGRYDELKDEATRRYGGLPPWWRPLE